MAKKDDRYEPRDMPAELGILNWKREDRADGYIKFEFTSARGVEIVTVKEITADERAGRRLMGQPVGKNLEHCLYLGLKYCPNFADQVDAFYIDTRPDPLLERLRLVQPGSVKIELYGAK